MFRKALGKDDLPVNLQSLSDAELPAMVTEVGALAEGETAVMRPAALRV